MIIEFKLPELGENIASGDVTSVPVKVGDTVKKNQTLLELEAGKASMEIPSPADGVLKALHVKVGDTVKAGQLVVEIESGDQKAKVKDQKPEKKPEPKPEPEPVKAPEPKPEPKPVVEPKSEAPAPEPRPLTSEAAKPAFPAVSAAPNVRRLARELGVIIHDVPASDPDGHISEEDVKAFARESLQNGRLPGLQKTASAVRIEKMTPTRKAIMEHMAHCWATIPHVTQHDMADITRLEALRKRYAPKAEAAGAKLTLTAILVKIIAAALKVHPKFNCSIDSQKAEILYKSEYNIGIAVDTPKGLLVPVIRDAEQKNIVELAQSLTELSIKARDGKMSLADLQGGTFTITNLGGIGGSFFTPIVNSPEVAILGVGRAVMDPCVGSKDGLCAPRMRLPLSLSYDHRIIDGADGARFLRWIVDAIEEPLLISLQG
jgi:pyruvate dehydrogenase E2 component (dihydrolipoamide acetyltransferase)